MCYFKPLKCGPSRGLSGRPAQAAGSIWTTYVCACVRVCVFVSDQLWRVVGCWEAGKGSLVSSRFALAVEKSSATFAPVRPVRGGLGLGVRHALGGGRFPSSVAPSRAAPRNPQTSLRSAVVTMLP